MPVQPKPRARPSLLGSPQMAFIKVQPKVFLSNERSGYSGRGASVSTFEANSGGVTAEGPTLSRISILVFCLTLLRNLRLEFHPDCSMIVHERVSMSSSTGHDGIRTRR